MSDLLAGPILSDPFDPPNPPLPCLQVVFIKISLRKTITKSRKTATYQNKRSMICEEVPYQILLTHPHILPFPQNCSLSKDQFNVKDSPPKKNYYKNTGGYLVRQHHRVPCNTRFEHQSSTSKVCVQT